MKQAQTSIQSPYYTLNKLTTKTKYLWMACHGYGQLAKYFMRRFDVLDPEENFVIVPQGLSLFYLDAHEFKYQKVGASWVSREYRQMALDNMQAYLNATFIQETKGFDLSKVEISLFGFSQGTAAVTRWGIVNKIPFRRLFFWAGTFPLELTEANLSFLNPEETEVVIFMGRQDSFFQSDLFKQQVDILKSLFPNTRIVRFEGGHEVQRKVLLDAAPK